MHPFLREGESVGVEWIDSSLNYTPQTGELILGRSSDGSWVVHRVTGPGLKSKGDRSFAWDDFNANQVWGRVVSVKSELASTPRPLQVTPVDRLIGVVSRLTMSRSRSLAALARRLVYGLSLLRRALL